MADHLAARGESQPQARARDFSSDQGAEPQTYLIFEVDLGYQFTDKLELLFGATPAGAGLAAIDRIK